MGDDGVVGIRHFQTVTVFFNSFFQTHVNIMGYVIII
jgi:hypothetical protein